MAKARAYEVRLFDRVVLTFSIGHGLDGDAAVDLGLAGERCSTAAGSAANA